jgi:hypothetical protein
LLRSHFQRRAMNQGLIQVGVQAHRHNVEKRDRFESSSLEINLIPRTEFSFQSCQQLQVKLSVFLRRVSATACTAHNTETANVFARWHASETFTLLGV